MLLAYWYNLVMPTMFVLKGGDYSMKAMLFNPLLTGASAWMIIINGFAFASYAIAVTSYLCVVFPGLTPYSTICSIVIATLFYASSIKGSRFITILENIMTIVLIAALILFVIFGIPNVDMANFFNMSADGGFFHGGFSGFIAAIAIMGWACQGTTMGPIAMAAVTKNPKKTIAKSIVIITALLAVVYGLIAYVAGGVLPYDQVAGANLSVTAAAIFPKGLYIFFVVGGGIGAIATSMLGGIAMMRYPTIQVAEDGWLPSVFKKTTKNGYPYVTYIVLYLLTIIPIVTGMSLDSVVSLCMIPMMLMNIYMNLACITLPKKFLEQWEKRSMKMPLWFYNVCSVVGAVCAGVVAYNLFVDLTPTTAALTVAIVVGLLFLSWLRLKQGAVKAEDINAKKAEILKEAIAADVEE